jgi:hypothetical protein
VLVLSLGIFSPCAGTFKAPSPAIGPEPAVTNAAPEAMRNFALCAQQIPARRSGEVLDRGLRWRVYEFVRQFDAIRFCAAFNGQWLVRDEFHFVDQPRGLPMMEALDQMYGKRPHR